MNKFTKNRCAAFFFFCLPFGCGGAAADLRPAPTWTLQATELAREFEEDEIRAARIYVSARVRVTGKVSSIVARSGGGFALTFRTSIYIRTPTRCYFDAGEGGGLSDVKSNEEISVVGTIAGYADAEDAIVLDDCRLP